MLKGEADSCVHVVWASCSLLLHDFTVNNPNPSDQNEAKQESENEAFVNIRDQGDQGSPKQVTAHPHFQPLATAIAMPPPRNPFLSFGLPFLTFMVVGLQGLSYVTRGRYEVKDEIEKQQALMTTDNKVVLPPQRHLSELDIPPVTDYDIVRVPRPEPE